MLTFNRLPDITSFVTDYIGYDATECVFFDIETTGFSSKNALVYLIGCVYYKDNKWHAVQWFADSLIAEADILAAFFDFIKTFKVLVSFNGDGFDIPFLLKRAEYFGINNSLSKMQSIDIFRLITPIKKFLKLDNYKQKSIEVFLDIKREDTKSGGELINVYNEYLNTKEDSLLQLLLLHNYDDICALLGLLPILSYLDISEGNYSLEAYEKNASEIIFTCKLQKCLPKRISLGFKDFYITALKDTLKLRVGIYTGELKFFYSNYQDYYYLPSEDMAIHKSVAFYVDRDFRTKAKAANCYSKKSSCFIPQLTETSSTYFKIEYFDKLMYIELNEDFLNNKELILNYIKDTIKAV